MLGIKFSVNLPDMVELNYLPKLIEIRKLLKQWKVRRMTPIGRLTVLKTLIIPKLNHLILALPMPNDNFLKDLESEMFEFLWNSKIHKVKKDTVFQDFRLFLIYVRLLQILSGRMFFYAGLRLMKILVK